MVVVSGSGGGLYAAWVDAALDEFVHESFCSGMGDIVFVTGVCFAECSSVVPWRANVPVRCCERERVHMST